MSGKPAPKQKATGITSRFLSLFLAPEILYLKIKGCLYLVNIVQLFPGKQLYFAF